jgi:hypothetical protein
MARAPARSGAARGGTRPDRLDWADLGRQLEAQGYAETGPLLSPTECRAISAMYDDADRFRSTIDMARHRFGSGHYRYFAYPLPDLVAELREAFYGPLRRVACEWAGKLRRPAPWPQTLTAWLEQCHHAGQTKPTPILLRYGPGDWNALHRDLYGDLVFPLQVIIGLDRPGQDFEGGELLLVEQRPRAQSRGHAITVRQGHAVIIATRERPVPSARGWSAGPMRHGVSTVRSGRRHTLGLLFHDAT